MSYDAQLMADFDAYFTGDRLIYREIFDYLLNLISQQLPDGDDPLTDEQLRDMAYDIVYDKLRIPDDLNWKRILHVFNGWHMRAPLPCQ